MISVPFNKVGTGGIKLDDINIPGRVDGTEWDDCDQFMIWKPASSGYDQFYYYNDGTGDEGWYTVGDFTYTDTFDSLYPDGLSAGQAMWFLPTSSDSSVRGAVTTSGSVEDSDDTGWVNLVANKYNMLANPYPVAWKLSAPDTDYSIEGMATGTEWDGCDQFMIWKPETSGYDQFYYYDDGAGDKGWYTVGDFTYTDTFDSLYPNGLPAGKPFWFLPSSTIGTHADVKIKFYNPIAK